MKEPCLFLMLCLFSIACAQGQTPPAPPADAKPVPPPAVAPQRSAADLEKLVAPIALYPDALIATILPASVYPLEIVQAARFVANTNNLAKLDEQPWDRNVKAVARVPQVIKQMNDDLSWTMELGEAFLAQDKDVMDAIQSMRAKAQQVGTLKTTPQQVVTVTNMVVETTIDQKVVVVTNTIVQIQPASSTVMYVPTYNPAVVYYPPPPTYVGPPPAVSFAAGVAVGAIIANNCDWHYGGCWHGDVDIDIDRNVNIDRDVNVNTSRSTSANATGTRAISSSAQQKWQPDQSRLAKSGTPTASASASSRQARGWGSGGGGPSAATTGARSPAGTAAARPSTGAAPATRPAPSASAGRPSPSPSASPSNASPSASRASSSGSAFSGASNGSRASSTSSRGSSSRSGGGGRR
jgi:hypothetical protein